MMAGTPTVALDNHVTLEMDTTQSLPGPLPAFFSVGEENQVYFAKVIVVLAFCNVHPNLILILFCV